MNSEGKNSDDYAGGKEQGAITDSAQITRPRDFGREGCDRPLGLGGEENNRLNIGSFLVPGVAGRNGFVVGLNSNSARSNLTTDTDTVARERALSLGDNSFGTRVINSCLSPEQSAIASLENQVMVSLFNFVLEAFCYDCFSNKPLLYLCSS